MSHNLRLISSLTKVVSPRLKKHAIKIPRAAYTSSNQSPPPSSISSKPDKNDKKAFSVPPKPTEEPRVVEKGDTYKAGETYYSFNEYSFYDFEKNMRQHRATQPSALPKKKVYCDEVQEEEPEIIAESKGVEIRRLLPDPWGYLVEWPSREVEKVEMPKEKKVSVNTVPKQDQEYYPVVENAYKVRRNPKNDPYYKARITF